MKTVKLTGIMGGRGRHAVAAYLQRGMAAQKAADEAIPATAAPPPRPPTSYRLQGIAAALGALAREQMEPDLAAMVLDSLGLTIADLERASNRNRPIILHKFVKPEHTRSHVKQMIRKGTSAQIVHKPTDGGICLHP